ncbi:MAG: FxsA family protein [Candidatus Omnitrophica bacterium]|nr:FxsA family protein [Candidatus Omnitrophota bacterium]MBU1048129.1 FxsA family protein [Candidatus Omnitrophota bacterium]MBU1630724.1 FxsA family protein [Candidatus Omnitrophota bacterium]MBU1766662.1 FxsA family protein [Candidatus Omnitrophota bacterium]MBU1889224.1 FxsA family protein [Candidatus Omnitrophota bacterium]
MLGYLILLFTLIPIIELALLIEIGKHIGVIYTLTIVIVTGVLGAFLAREQGFKTLQKIETEVNGGIMPGEEIIDGVIILCGGILLLTPGLLTDAVGFLALIPVTRAFIKKELKKKIQKIMDDGKVIKITSFKSND